MWSQVLKKQIEINVIFIKHSDSVYGFNVPTYRHTVDKLVIDPNPDRLWGTYYGGGGNEYSTAITSDSSGNLYILGFTNSQSMIATSGAHQTTISINFDGFISKFSASGQRLWSTYHGGNGSDFIYEAAIDGQGNIITYGKTGSTLNVTTSGAFQTTHGNTNGELDSWLSKFSTSGVRQWSTYYGGSGREELDWALGLDASNNIFIGGATNSTNNIASPGAYKTTLSGIQDGYLAKFNTNGSRLWGTYVGGTGDDRGTEISVDNQGNPYLIGNTNSDSNIATSGTYSTILFGGFDGFITKFNTNGTKIWGTYLGGASNEELQTSTFDNNGNIIVAGLTNSVGGIVTPCAHLDHSISPWKDPFIWKINCSNGLRVWGTYYGGLSQISGLSCDSLGNIYICGTTQESSFSTPNAYQTTLTGGSDAFISKLNFNGIEQFFSFYGGNSSNEVAYSIRYISNGEIAICGGTTSENNIASIGSFQPTYTGGEDAFLVKFKDNSPPVNNPALSLSFTELVNSCNGSPNGTLTVQANGTSPYDYAWSNGKTTTTISGLLPGDYQVTVTDANGCSSSIIGTIISNPNPSFDFSISIGVCMGQSNGIANIHNIVGAEPFTALWSNGDTNFNPHNLSPGSYSVTVTDGNGCMSTKIATIASYSLPSISLNSSQNNCFNENNGSATILVSSGAPPYTFLWNNGQTSSTASKLAAGNYTVTVYDANGCTQSQSINIEQSPQLLAEFSSTNGTEEKTCDATITMTQGTPPYTYLWSNGQTSQSATNILSGPYYVTVTDANGCDSVFSNICSPVSANNHFDQNGFTIFPNPSTGIFNISMKVPLAVRNTIKVYDLLGNVILKKGFDVETVQTVDLSSNSSGFYIIEIADGQELIWRRRVVKVN